MLKEREVNVKMFLEKIFWSAYVLFNIYKQKKVPFLSKDKIKEIQSERVKKIIKHAFETVPYYRKRMKKLNLTPLDFRSAQDLKKLPFITREDVQRDPNQFISTKYGLSKCLELITGGTTGVPITVFHDFRPLLLNMAIHQREMEAIIDAVGKSRGYKRVSISKGNQILPAIGNFCRKKLFTPSLKKQKSLSLSIFDSVEANSDLINEYQPNILGGYGSYLETLFKYCASNQIKFNSLKAISYGAEMLSQPSRDLIEKHFHIPIFSIYGATEAPLIGFECEEHSGLHLHSDICVVDIVNKNGVPVESGDLGEVAISNLTNKVMVLLNYILGDLGRPKSEECKCGRNLPLIEVEGRNDDAFILPDGRFLFSGAIRNIFRRNDFLKFQVIQEEIDQFTVSIVPFRQEDFPRLEEEILENLREHLGETARIKIQSVSSIPLTPRGKSKPIISKLVKE